MRIIMSVVLLAFTASLSSNLASAAEKSMEEVKERSQREAGEFKTALWANKEWSKAINESIIAANKKYPADAKRTDKTPVFGIADKDKVWVEWYRNAKLAKSKKEAEPAMPSLASEVMNHPCSEALRKAKATDKAVSEVFIMDRMGATVCAADATSDFDQGDEDKWMDPWLKGTDPHVNNPTRDASADNFQTQVSYLVKNEGQNIGVITIGILVKH